MEVPGATLSKLLQQVNADPLLPRKTPTEAFWQLPAHETLSAVQSPELPQQVEYAIIGSGVTGCSIAQNLLEHASCPKDSRVSVFEARTLCSGATGRNGGALTSFVPYAFTKLTKQFGEEQAVKIGRPSLRRPRRCALPLGSLSSRGHKLVVEDAR